MVALLDYPNGKGYKKEADKGYKNARADQYNHKSGFLFFLNVASNYYNAQQ